MTRHDLAHQRLRSQRLIGPACDGPIDTVRWFGAMQAQEYPEARWAIAMRAPSVTSRAIDEALATGTLLRTHVLRPTWHVVHPADIRWMLDLTAPRIAAKMASRWRELELDEATFYRANTLFADALRGGKHLSRLELAEVLQTAGISTAGQRLPHLLMRAELDQVICSGAQVGKQLTFALFDDRVPSRDTLERDHALAELTRRYFQSHGPATEQDFAWWSGLPLKDVRAGLAMAKDVLTSVNVDGGTFWLAPQAVVVAPDRPIVHLLPNYDEHVVAYKDHDLSFSPKALEQRVSQQDILRNHFILDGEVVGEWRRVTTKKAIAIHPRPMVPLDASVRHAFEAAAERYGRFMALPLTVTWP